MDDDAKRAHKQELTNLGRAFREARERSGLSEREAAGAVRGISLDGIHKIEAGERPQLQLRADNPPGPCARRRTIDHLCPGRKPRRRVTAPTATASAPASNMLGMPAVGSDVFRQALAPTIDAVRGLADAVGERAERHGHQPSASSRAMEEIAVEAQFAARSDGWQEPIRDTHTFGGHDADRRC